MKRLIRRLLRKLAGHDLTWRFLNKTLIHFANYSLLARAQHHLKTDEHFIPLLAGDLTVRHGPFKGMRYPEFSSAGSMLWPKLLGSYEQELHPLIEEVCRGQYTEIINIGCGEGYYTVGLALRIPGARVFAYDIDERALKLCQKMAGLNGVSHRVFFSRVCTGEVLKDFPFTGRGLIFCDCEGCEKDLFIPPVVANLTGCDLIIELHDLLDIHISTYIGSLFQETHDQIYVGSVDDLKKAKTYDYEEIRGLDLPTRKQILAEHRPAWMEWVFLRARAGRKGPISTEKAIIAGTP
jgi:SAM-dependent methyltransferase